MIARDVFIAEEGDASNCVQIHRMQIADELGQVGNRPAIVRSKRMIEWNAERAIAILNVEYHGVSADLVPMLNDLYPFSAARHRAR